jgi:probable F420-dependent oxidoreductase
MTMRFTLLDPSAVALRELPALALEAERVGFDTFALNDGTFQMEHTRGVYPYSPDRRRNWDPRAPFYEPMTVLPAIGLLTARIRIMPAVLKLPLRHPLMLAKQVATAAVMCDDRFVLGVGASWAPEEYEFLGVPWARRGRVMTESIEALRLLLSGESVEYHGEIIDFDRVVARPAPRHRVKILVGGHQPPSLRRAASLGDGWIGTGIGAATELRAIIEQLRNLCDEYGRDWASFEIHTFLPGTATLDDYRRLEEAGVTDAGTLPINAGGTVVLGESTRQRLRGEEVVAARDPANYYARTPPGEKLDALRAFADSIISHWRA